MLREMQGVPNVRRLYAVSLTAFSLSVFVCGLASAAVVTVHTDSLVLDGAASGTFKGTPFWSQVNASGIAEFYFLGDLDLRGDTVTFTGSRPASFLVGNDALLQGATLDLSAVGPQGILGGGSGGTGGIGGRGGRGGDGGVGALGGHGGAGGGWFYVDGDWGTDGRIGEVGTAGTNGLPGTSGTAGTGGRGNDQGGGLGGSGGTGGAGGAAAERLANGGPAGRGGGGSHTWGWDGGDASSAGMGRMGGRGGHGNPGGGGTHAVTGFDTLSAGGAGGGGGGAGGAGGAGGGQGGGGGGGGGGQEGGLFHYGADGAGGGGGGAGGGGGGGYGGGQGGTGGGGGGALEVRAHGRLDIGAARILSRGGDGQLGWIGKRGQNGSDGSEGYHGNPYGVGAGGWAPGTGGAGGEPAADPPLVNIVYPASGGSGGSRGGCAWGWEGGGYGGRGSQGGKGGYGGLEGRGGTGGGGAGGTVKLVGAAVLSDAQTVVDASGGATPGGSPGQDGRLLVGDNCGATYSGGGTHQAPETGAGPTRHNPFLANAYPATPYIPGLVGGAEIYGLTTLGAADFADVYAAAPLGAFAALTRMDAGPDMPEFVGYDALLFVNLLDEQMDNPCFGVHQTADAYFAGPLLTQGYMRDPLFGGTGPEPLDGLPALSVYATLIPENLLSGTYWMHAEFQGQYFETARVGILNNGEALYLTQSAPGSPVPAPGALLLTGIGACIVGLRRRSRTV